MNRRAFVTGLGAVLAAPLAAEAQQTARRIYRVGVLLGAPESAVEASMQAFREGLRELGYVEEQNLAIELRTATAESRLDGLASDLLRSKSDILVAWGTPATLAAKRASSSVPIVMVSIGDPLGAGLVASLSRPGGNVTGVTNVLLDLIGKQLQLLTELRPGVAKIAVLGGDRRAPTAQAFLQELQTAAQSLGIQLQLLEVRAPGELDAAFAAIGRERPSAVLVLGTPLFLTERTRIAKLSQKAQLPTMFARSENVEAGGLISYGPKLSEQFRQAAVYVHKILNGAKPGELPIERPTKLELVINLKTAKALGLTIPPSLLLRADQVIE